MAKRAPREAKTEVARVWQQRSTRAAILEAARRLAAREDGTALTLARVADEANFSPNTVYAYFVNKSELMLAIVADDLAALAREMRDVFPANEDLGTETEDDSQPEIVEDAQSEERENSEPVADAVVTDDTSGASDASLPQEAVSESSPQETEESTVVPIVEIAEEASHQPEPLVEQESAPEAAPTDVAPEITSKVEQQEQKSTDAPALQSATEESAQLDCIPEVALEAPPTSISEHNANEAATPEKFEFADDKPEPTPIAESQLPSMPLVEKKWALQPDTDRNDEDASVLVRLQESVARLEARPVDAWLERRLRELERMIASLEERQGNNERSSDTASGLFEETVRGLQARLEAVEKNRQLDFAGNAKTFSERMDASEMRLREMLGELRTLTMVSSSRLDVLEGDAYKKAAYDHLDLAPAIEVPAAIADVPQIDASSEKADSPVENTIVPAAEPSYLSQARRSAMAAAAQTVAQPNDSLQRFASTMSSIKTASSSSRYLIAGGIALLIVLLGTGLALKRQAADQDALAQTPVQIAATSHGVHAKFRPNQKMAPQIRLASLANRGNADAQLLLGLEYLDGAGAVKNESEAAQWISRSATHGDAIAQFWLGTLYANGRGVKTDPALAMHWYEEAAMQGNRKAMHQLAVSYAEGWGAARNYAEAARWFSRAASLGYVDSAFNLGVLYERGLGMPQSLLDAYKWYSIAAAMGDKGSPPRLTVLKTQMNADDIAGATQAANNFAPDTMDQAANTAPQIAQLPKS
jgi:TPR repeat protein